jgi:DNA-binding NtrC family response regulator
MNINLSELIEFTRSLNILFVEDNDDVRNQLLKFLKNFFNEIDVAFDGVDAFDKFQKNQTKYNLVITDISMPRLDGIELSKKIMSLNINQKIIIVSAHTEADKLNKLKEIGVFDILQKPVGYNNLIDSLEKLYNHFKNN